MNLSIGKMLYKCDKSEVLRLISMQEIQFYEAYDEHNFSGVCGLSIGT